MFISTESFAGLPNFMCPSKICLIFSAIENVTWDSYNQSYSMPSVGASLVRRRSFNNDNNPPAYTSRPASAASRAASPPGTLPPRYMSREGTGLLAREGTTLSRDGTMLSREGTMLSREGTMLSREGTMLSREGTMLSREGTMMGPDSSLLYSEDPMDRSVSRTARDIEFDLEMETLARVKPVTPGDVNVSCICLLKVQSH